MLTQPRIIERQAQPYAAVRTSLTIPFGEAIPGALGKLFQTLESKGIEPRGPVFFKYNFINMPELEIDFSVPVATNGPIGGGVVTGVLPAGRYAEVTYTGHYDGLIDANAALIGWARDNGIRWDAIETPEGDTFVARLETYLNGPDDEPDPGKWETIVQIKIRE
ncbi:GyrI-like domain-containing protein [Devosia sp. ZB163]|uniref:GyrI-like domain-containing protein n=1 Tax=Devosia sp. ZB163 TaxID=3025938 RepID=UPI00235FC589|nr:GyrI-like domain-containing protein [Devosia sp. ZB163]MDC9824802.1 GyrI-like domain-containing protein [Devosia sp. ZB163]